MAGRRDNSREGMKRAATIMDLFDFGGGASSASEGEGELFVPEVFIKVNKAGQYNLAKEVNIEKIPKGRRGKAKYIVHLAPADPTKVKGLVERGAVTSYLQFEDGKYYPKRVLLEDLDLVSRTNLDNQLKVSTFVQTPAEKRVTTKVLLFGGDGLPEVEQGEYLILKDESMPDPKAGRPICRLQPDGRAVCSGDQHEGRHLPDGVRRHASGASAKRRLLWCLR